MRKGHKTTFLESIMLITNETPAHFSPKMIFSSSPPKRKTAMDMGMVIAPTNLPRNSSFSTFVFLIAPIKENLL